MDFKQLPKVELHLHLDCSLSFDVVQKLRPETTLHEYKDRFIAPSKCTDLVDYINRADSAIQIMQTEEQLRAVTIDLVNQIHEDSNLYTEIRFAPLLHTQSGLKPEEVVEIVADSITEASNKKGTHAELILCTLRHYDKQQSLETAHLAQKFFGHGVVGFDLAADEAGYGLQNHIDAYQFVHSKGIHCTCHAGEARGAESVWEVLQLLKPERIGHGVRSFEDSKLVDYLKEHRIHLEVCPTSNIATNVFDKHHDHNIDEIFNSGVSMNVNTDGRALSNVNLSQEYELLHKVFGWDKHHFLTCNLNGIKASFTTQNIKDHIEEQLRETYKRF
ncbi:MAG: adenosine deaminase [Bacteroidota bacterium]